MNSRQYGNNTSIDSNKMYYHYISFSSVICCLNFDDKKFVYRYMHSLSKGLDIDVLRIDLFSNLFHNGFYLY